MGKSLKILSRPQGNAEEYGRWSVNPYLGCKHGCLYCYLKKGVWANKLGGDVPVLKDGIVSEDHAYHLAMVEIIDNREQIIKDGGLFMTFTSDPCNTETRRLFFRIIKECIGDAHGFLVPVTILTKSADFMPITDNPRFSDVERCREWATTIGVFSSHADLLNSRFSTGFTLTGHDELEPGASPNADRIKAIRVLSELGFSTWASIEPVIDFDASYRMINEALNAGCRHFKIGLLTNNTHVVRKPFSFGEHHFEAYDHSECCSFVGFVMEATLGRATVYWKQSFYDFFGDEPIHGMTAYEFLHQWEHSVDKDWNMFGKED